MQRAGALHVLKFALELGDAVADRTPVGPDIARKVAAAITSGRAQRGLMVCGTGVGGSARTESP